jgi:hypothetical protein
VRLLEYKRSALSIGGKISNKEGVEGKRKRGEKNREGKKERGRGISGQEHNVYAGKLHGV